MVSARPGDAVNFIRALFEHTSGPVFLTALPSAREIATRVPNRIRRFALRNDEPGQDGVYFCPSALVPHASKAEGEKSLRSKRNARETGAAWSDIDAKDISVSLDEAARTLRALRIPPSFIVWSGNGLHAYWLLSEAFDVQAERERFEALLRRLCDRFGGDPAPAHIAPLMRLPGTHNRKRGACLPVTVEGDGRRYHLEDLEEWLDEQPVAIARKPSAPRIAPEPESNPFLVAAREHGLKPALDVEAELARMQLGNIHHTCVRVSASLLSRGATPDEVVGRLLPEIERALAGSPEPFRERREERRLHAMCRSWLAKHPNVKPLPKRERPMRDEPPRDEPAEVHQFSARAAPKPKPQADDKPAMPAIVADGVIAAIRDKGGDIMLAEGAMWLYGDGVWREVEAADETRLRVLIQEGCAFFEKQHDSKVANAAWKLLNEHPALFQPEVPWLKAPRIACQNGVLDVVTRAFEPSRPDHYARTKIGAAYDPQATCPAFVGFLESLFDDRPAADRAAAIGLIQEWLGAALTVPVLSREERKALVLLGPSRTGKTELAECVRLLIGGNVSGASVSEISERFGLSSLYGASAWIRDDAINEGDVLDPQRFKTIVTGEPIDIERKHMPVHRGVRLGLPVLLTTNALPRARDASDAIFNRALILEMKNVVSEDEAHTIHRAAGIPRGQTLAQFILEREGPGILTFVLEGLARLFERGRYDPPAFTLAANQRFKDDNNPVSEFARSCLRASKTSRVARHDLLCAYHGWQLEMEGEAARAIGARAFFPRLRAVLTDLGEMQENSGIRFLTGLALTDEGISHWERHIVGPQLKGGSKGTATAKEQVNKPWNTGQSDEGEPF